MSSNTGLQQSRRCTCDTANFLWPSPLFSSRPHPLSWIYLLSHNYSLPDKSGSPRFRAKCARPLSNLKAGSGNETLLRARAAFIIKVHVLSRWLVGSAYVSSYLHYCEPLSSEPLPMIIRNLHRLQLSLNVRDSPWSTSCVPDVISENLLLSLKQPPKLWVLSCTRKLKFP